MKNKRIVEVVEAKKLASDVYDIWVKDEEIAMNGKPGQFVSLYCNDESRLLPRPISICELNKERALVRFVFRIVGKGTEELSRLRVNDKVQVLGPIGNGFKLEGKNVLIIGGGIGIPPLLELAKNLGGNKHIILGFKDERFLESDFEKYGKVYVSTEDGSKGTRGNVIDAIYENNIVNSDLHNPAIDMIFTCGPTPMLRGIKDFAKKHNIKVQVSLEERMACGVGVCLSCVCKTKEKDENTNVNNARICKEGPVFYADNVEI